MHRLLPQKDRVEKNYVCVQLLKDMFRLWRRGSSEECVCCGYVGGAVVKSVCVLWLCWRGSAVVM